MAEITVSEQIIEVLDYLGEKFGIVIDWNANNVIPIIQDLCGKYINWELATSALFLILSIIGIIAAIKLLKRGLKALDGEDEVFDSDCGIGMMFLGFVMIVGFPIAGIVEILDIIKCITFPELQIYEYVMELIKDFNN